jgi:RND family efflux transporter MFP subunit
VLGLGAIVAVGWGPKLRQKAERESATAALGSGRSITYSTARVSPLQSQLVLPGTAFAIETATIYARTTGFVREFKVDIGDHVKAGDVLAILDTPEIESDARSARARAAESALNEKIQEQTAERYRRLAEAGVNSKEQAAQAEAQANSAKAAASTSQAEVTRTSTLLDFRFVRAPFDGVVTRRNIEKGSLVTAGSGAGVSSLYEVTRTETLKIWVDVPQALAQEIHVGDEARVLSGTETVVGTIARTAGALDPLTRTLRVEIHIAGDQGILAGSFVRVSLDIHAKKPPVLVPANAIVPRPDGTYVFIAGPDGAVRMTAVEMGRELGVDVEVVSGLNGGERVATNPPENLAQGEKVHWIAPPPPAATATPAAPQPTGDKNRAPR